MNEPALAFRLTPLAMVIASVLFHQVSRLWEQNFSTIGDTYAPVLMIRLPRWAAALGQVVALPLALVLALGVHDLASRIGCVCLVVYWLVATQRRLSDHSWLGAVAGAIIAFTPASVHAVAARDLLIGVYLTAAVFKINDEYLFTERSAGRVVMTHYLRLLGLRPFDWLVRLTPVLVIVTELAAGMLLLNPGTERWALYLAIAMHWAFGVSGNFPFSVIALVLWVVSLSPGDAIPGFPGGLLAGSAVAIGSGVLALLLGRMSAGPRPTDQQVKDALQGVCYGYLAAIAVAGFDTALPLATAAARVTDWLIGIGFALNFVLVVVGVKLEWSFAMFTSLRPFGRSWLERRRSSTSPRYYLLTLPRTIPKSLLHRVDPRFIYLATRADSAVHETVAYCLEAAARESGATFSPRQMIFDDQARALVPADLPDSAPPRLRLLTYPAVVPRSLDVRYLA